MSDVLVIRLPLWASGCLADLLAAQIEAVERRARATEIHHATYKAQLKACLDAYDAAKADLMARVGGGR